MVFMLCFSWAARFVVSDLFLPGWFRALQDEGRLCPNEEVLLQLSRKTKANIMSRGLLKFISDCEANPVVALLVFLRANVVDCMDWKRWVGICTILLRR